MANLGKKAAAKKNYGWEDDEEDNQQAINAQTKKTFGEPPKKEESHFKFISQTKSSKVPPKPLEAYSDILIKDAPGYVNHFIVQSIGKAINGRLPTTGWCSV